ncbi:zinc finger protein [Bounagaea algeriensis]
MGQRTPRWRPAERYRHAVLGPTSPATTSVATLCARTVLPARDGRSWMWPTCPECMHAANPGHTANSGHTANPSPMNAIRGLS